MDASQINLELNALYHELMTLTHDATTLTSMLLVLTHDVTTLTSMLLRITHDATTISLVLFYLYRLLLQLRLDVIVWISTFIENSQLILQV